MQVEEVVEARDDVAGVADKKGRKARSHDPSVGLLKDDLNSLEQKVSISCDIEARSCKVAETKSNVNGLVAGLRQKSIV